LDAESSKGISRHLCDFILQNDRLCLRPFADRGLMQNGEIVNPGSLAVVKGGDSFSVTAGRGKVLTFRTVFKASADVVRQIRFETAT
jgi:hypothetical protein